MNKSKGTVIVLDTFDDETRAKKEMFCYARNLRRLKQTERYGVFIEQRKGAWWLCLLDRHTP